MPRSAGRQTGAQGQNSALYLYLIYGALTFITIVLLFTGGMPLFDSVCHGMGIAGTGGFGIKNDGLSYYNSPYLDGVVTVTMLLFGVNFTLYYYMLIRRFREVRKNTELRVYFSIVAISTALIMLNIRPVYHSVGKCFRYAVFRWLPLSPPPASPRQTITSGRCSPRCC